jgi:photosystem II stability/assembly factor-like uncharacterized protein
MVSPNAGWALRLSVVDRLQAVVRTADGGRRWTPVTPAEIVGAPSVSLTGTGPLAAALVVRRPKDGVTVWRTGDGGRTWKHGAPLPSRFGGGVQFLGEAYGWLTLGGGVAGGSSGLSIFATDDGGMQWDAIMVTSGATGESTPGALPLSCDKGGTSFATPLRGFAGGLCSGGSPFLYGSVDGGRTWHRQTLPGMTHGCECLVDTPIFFSASGGVLTAGAASQGQRVYLTTDAGRTWHTLRVRAMGPGEQSFVDARHGWVTTAPRAISRTSDGGVRWRAMRTPFDASQATIEFVSHAAGFAIEDYPDADRIWATTDGGGHWRPIIARRA